jgi:transcriptional regulator with XRE-family HTH domain
MPQEVLAKIIDVTTATIYKWENGITRPSTSTAQKLAAILETTVAYLMGETDDPSLPEIPPTSVGRRIRKARKSAECSQYELARRIGVRVTAIHRWETDIISPSAMILEKIADALNTSVLYLMGEADDSVPPKTEIFNITPIHTDPEGWRPIPLYSKMTAACAGAGNGLAYVESEIESWHYFPREIYGIWDKETPPYMVHVEGDSMEDANIHDGSIVIINPAEEVYDGESALVCWNQDEVAIKLVYWLMDGGVELQAANPEHKKIYTFSKEDIEEGMFEIKGKVMWTGLKPKRMK